MTPLWTYFWPAFGLGAAAGVIAGAIGFRKHRRRAAALALGFAASILLAALWHGPLGGADQFAGRVGRGIGLFLDIINAQAALVTARSNRAAAQYGVDQARAALARAIGAPLPR